MDTEFQFNNQKTPKSILFARGLGVFSLILGVSELARPRRVARASGAPIEGRLLRACGVREIGSGIAILSSARPVVGLWSRVIGDAVDFGVLLRSARSFRTKKARVQASAAALGAITIADITCAVLVTRTSRRERQVVRVQESITVNSSPEDLFRFWRNVENLPRVMNHLISVRATDPQHSHWVARGPMGRTITWDAEITAEEPNRRVSWRSLPGAEIENWGSVRFVPVPGRKGTEVHIELDYIPPAGRLGRQLAKLMGEEPSEQIRRDLRPFKQMIETGEIASTRGQPSGRQSGETWLDRMTH